MDSIRVSILQKVFSQCAKMLNPNPNDKDQPLSDPNDPNSSPGKYNHTVPDPDSEYSRVFNNVIGKDSMGQDIHGRFDFDLLQPEGQELMVINHYINHIKFGAERVSDLHKRGLLPALFLEMGTDAYSFDFEGVQLAKEGEVMPIILRLWSVEPKPSERTQAAYRFSNPIYISEIREQLDYLLDRNEFIYISQPRIGYTFASKVQDCGIKMCQTMQGLRAPFEAVDFRFEVVIEKQKEIDDRYN